MSAHLNPDSTARTARDRAPRNLDQERLEQEWVSGPSWRALERFTLDSLVRDTTRCRRTHGQKPRLPGEH